MASFSFWPQNELQTNPKETRWVVRFLLRLIAVVSTLMTNLISFCVNCWDSDCVTCGFPCSSWTTWLIPALIATVVGIMCRYYMSDHKSSWVLASQIHPILIIRRPSNVSNPQNTGHTQPGVCASSATREEWEEFERVHLHASAPHRQFGKSLLSCLPFTVFHSYYACFIFTCTFLCSVCFSCPFCHQSHQLGRKKHSNSDLWPV